MGVVSSRWRVGRIDQNIAIMGSCRWSADANLDSLIDEASCLWQLALHPASAWESPQIAQGPINGLRAVASPPYGRYRHSAIGVAAIEPFVARLSRRPLGWVDLRCSEKPLL